MHVVQTAVVGREEYSFDTGKLAKQAQGSVFVSVGDTRVLVTACRSNSARPGVDFLPLSCDYIEKGYAAGRIPGSYFRREGRPSTAEVLVARLIDRPIRPLFPEGFRNELQVIANVLSADNVTDPALMAINGASAALCVSDVPFDGPIAAVRVGRVDGQLLVNPTASERENSELDLIVAVSPNGIVMVEGDANFLPEAVIVEALLFAETSAQPLMDAQRELIAKVGKTKMEVTLPEKNADLYSQVEAAVTAPLQDAIRISEKMNRYSTLDAIKADVCEKLVNEEEDNKSEIAEYYGEIKKKAVRSMILDEKVRIDGRDYTTVRNIDTEVGILPRAHGSALFTRGETQSICTVTLGTSYDEQRVETLAGQVQKRFMLHYNFLPFCVGEARFLRGTSRRELGHGMLAERGLLSSVDLEEFPYVLRVVSEILESNGSSSMATVCGGSMAMMHAGIPVRCAVAGIAMGLIKEGDDIAILTDILGDEDHLGDMDFKVIGNNDGISGLQMDIKIDGLTGEVLTTALEQARVARLHILDEMAKTISTPADDISAFAPRIYTLLINENRIRDLIGPGGKNIRQIQADTDTKIEVEDDGTVRVAASNAEQAEAAVRMVKNYTAEPEIGESYMGRVVKVVDFGAFVNILPGKDGLVHISELANRRVEKVEDVLREGDEVLVKVIGLDRGKVKLSRKAAIADQEEEAPEAAPEEAAPEMV
ncbi:MAG: polyribonucleotide nucleotidyltransferase [Myxococcales bacterium]|nr:polyribonucleotide nucleotidyltransferase [Myxococcales bacterium]|tara:strand:- start:321 stop:2447 length:2127 start_codon:yes stop_codon:yes gene_type:complete